MKTERGKRDKGKITMVQEKAVTNVSAGMIAQLSVILPASGVPFWASPGCVYPEDQKIAFH